MPATSPRAGSSVELGEQAERPAVLGPEDGEVTVVERGHLVLAELDAREEHGGVDEPDPQIRVSVLQSGRSEDHVWLEVIGSIGTGSEFLRECQPWGRPASDPEEVLELDENGGGDDEVAGVLLHGATACGVALIPFVQGRDQPAGVEHEGHQPRSSRTMSSSPSSGCSASQRAEGVPGGDRKIPRRGLGASRRGGEAPQAVSPKVLGPNFLKTSGCRGRRAASWYSIWSVLGLVERG